MNLTRKGLDRPEPVIVVSIDFPVTVPLQRTSFPVLPWSYTGGTNGAARSTIIGTIMELGGGRAALSVERDAVLKLHAFGKDRGCPFETIVLRESVSATLISTKFCVMFAIFFG